MRPDEGSGYRFMAVESSIGPGSAIGARFCLPCHNAAFCQHVVKTYGSQYPKPRNRSPAQELDEIALHFSGITRRK